MPSLTNSMQIEVFKTGLSLLPLLLGWVLGQRIIAYWDMKKKRRELDIAIAAQFHRLYGEFKEVSRLWRAFCFTGERKMQINFPETTQWGLLQRAAAAEGGVEAVIVKLAAERALEKRDIKILGLFRQAYQILRETIRDCMPLKWTYDTPEYTLFNDLASKTALIISSERIKKQPCSEKAAETLRQITDIRPEDWKNELDRRAQQRERKEES
jgi:hypothetical protein